jgi:hypothetical protein
VLFIGLNPSTADARNDDATTRACIRFAQRWGYGELLLANLFAWCATKPSDLFAAATPVGRANDRALARVSERAALVVCAWGEGGRHLGRDAEVLDRLDAPHCIARLRSGRPGHPLYKSAHLQPIPLLRE